MDRSPEGAEPGSPDDRLVVAYPLIYGVAERWLGFGDVTSLLSSEADIADLYPNSAAGL